MSTQTQLEQLNKKIEDRREKELEGTDTVQCGRCGSDAECHEMRGGDEVEYLCDICHDDMCG